MGWTTSGGLQHSQHVIRHGTRGAIILRNPGSIPSESRQVILDAVRSTFPASLDHKYEHLIGEVWRTKPSAGNQVTS
jgi:hypothetical protein